eukprot:symbB.v1.2.017120.t3/scaffold1268.1/size213459/1
MKGNYIFYVALVTSTPAVYSFHSGVISAEVQPQGEIEIEALQSLHEGEEESDPDVAPFIRKMAGEWKVSPSQHLMRWYLDVPGYASSKFLMMLWTGNKMKIETGEKVKEHCTKGNKKAKFVVLNWNKKNKWECGWYDEKKDQIGAFHYIKDWNHRSGDGHSMNDNYWGTMDLTKRTAKGNCPEPTTTTTTTAAKSNAMAIKVSLVLLAIVSFAIAST